jgi:hypothetical protein
MADMLFRSRLRLAAESGLLTGIKITLALLVPILIIGWLMGDYATVRTQAQRGQAAFDYLNKAVAEQQKAMAQPGK